MLQWLSEDKRGRKWVFIKRASWRACGKREGLGSYRPWCGRMSLLSECTYIRNPELLEASSCSALHLPSHVLAPCRHTVCVCGEGTRCRTCKLSTGSFGWLPNVASPVCTPPPRYIKSSTTECGRLLFTDKETSPEGLSNLLKIRVNSEARNFNLEGSLMPNLVLVPQNTF